jgi:hypothetical protein
MLQKIVRMANQCTGVAFLILLAVTTQETDMKAVGFPGSKVMARYSWKEGWAYNGTSNEVYRTDHLIHKEFPANQRHWKIMNCLTQSWTLEHKQKKSKIISENVMRWRCGTGETLPSLTCQNNNNSKPGNGEIITGRSEQHSRPHTNSSPC